MKLSLPQQEFLPALQAVARSCGVRASLPVLANLLMEAENGTVKLSATNLELGVIKSIQADIQEEGAITVPAKTLLEIVGSLSGEKLEVESIGEHLKISTKHFQAKLNCIAESEFPTIPIITESSITVDSGVLKESLPQITFAAASDEGRPVLTGVLVEIKNDKLELVATDGFRLAHKHVGLKSSGNTGMRALIPRRTLEEVVRLLTGEDEESPERLGEPPGVEIGTSENQNQMIFKFKRTYLSSRLIEGQFPAWEKIIPASFENKTIVQRAALLRAVKLASVFAKDAANILKIETGDGKVKILSEAKEIGGQETELEAEVSGSPILIALSSRFLSEILQAISSQTVLIQFSGNLSPVVIRPADEPELEYVIMPIRLN